MLGIQPPSLRRPVLWAEYSEAELIAKVLYGRELSVPLKAGTSLSSTPDLAATTAYLRRLPSIAWDQVNRGQQLYDSWCVYCHGLYGRGDGMMAKQLPSPGHELYSRFCALCHGVDGHPPEIDTEAIGEAEAMPEELPQVTFNQAYFQTHSEEQVRLAVQHMLQQSRAIMPHFNGELSKDEVREILTYLRTLR
jgi:mono/diheme cytochrome c family protein